MSEVGFSQHKFQPHLNVVTLNGEQVNGLWREGQEFIEISMYAEHDMYDYYGKLLRDFSKSREQINAVESWIYETYKNHEILKTSGWSTKNQYWRAWIIKK